MSNNPLSSSPLHPLQPESNDRSMPLQLSQAPDPSIGSSITPPPMAPVQPIGPDPIGPMGQPPPPTTNPTMGQLTPSRSPSPMNTTAQVPPPTRDIIVPLNNLTSSKVPFQNKGDFALYFSSDDRVLSKHIEETHIPYDNQIDEVKPLFYLVQDNLTQTTQTVHDNFSSSQPREAFTLESINAHSNINIPNLKRSIEGILSELYSRRRSMEPIDAHETTMSILRLLSHFTWEAKAVLTLAAFAMNYGDFLLLVQIFTTNNLAKSMTMLKQLFMVTEPTGLFRSVFEAIDKLIQEMLNVTDCVIRIQELPLVCVSEDDPTVKAARTQIPIVVYWTIKSVVTAAPHITLLTNMNYDYTESPTNAAGELQHMTDQLTPIKRHLKSILGKLMEIIDEKGEIEAYKMLVDAMYNMTHEDNMPTLTRIIVQDDMPNLYDCNNRKRVHLGPLREKNVLLLISDLEILEGELWLLEGTWIHLKTYLYEILWLPIVDRSVPWTESMQAQFESIRATMPWYSVHHPSVVTNAFDNFARVNWNFRNKTFLAVLDKKGRVLNPNAMNMLWIWGGYAFPFTTEREEILWKDETWCLDLLIDGIDTTATTVLNWIRDRKYIFIYGGDNIDLIRRFVKEARAVALRAGITLEMTYVGESGQPETVREICAAIDAEPEVISNFWSEWATVYFFWRRMESMLFSKIGLKKADDLSDVIMQEVKKLLSYDKFPGGWALLSRGSEVILHGPMSTVLTALTRYEREAPFWENSIPPMTFAEAFKQQTATIHVQKPQCCRFEFPAASFSAGLMCPECHRPMEKPSTFVCCHQGPAYKR